MRSLFALTLSELQTFLEENGLPKYSADQVYRWLYKHFNMDLESWSNVGKKTKLLLKEHFNLHLPEIIWQGLSKDGTKKYLLKLHDGQSIESVVIPAKNRLTLCLSSQVGCAIGCTFCHTGTMGLKRNLSPEEIIGQYMALSLDLNKTSEDGQRLTNIVYMGQGEPLHNFENVKQATKIFLEDKGLGIGQRKIALSTSGLVPQIEKLGDFPPVNLAISLHAAHDHIRTELMPINKTYDLKRLLAAIRKIPLKAHRYISFEYILIKDLNDRQEDVDALVKLLPKKVSKVNIIPFNEYPGTHFKQPSKEKIYWFNQSLNQRGLVTTIRTTKGTDILAACGQLKSEMEKLNTW